MPPSAIFYEDSLEPCAANGITSWSKLPNPQLPLIFIGHEHKEETVDEVLLTFYSFIRIWLMEFSERLGTTPERSIV